MAAGPIRGGYRLSASTGNINKESGQTEPARKHSINPVFKGVFNATTYSRPPSSKVNSRTGDSLINTLTGAVKKMFSLVYPGASEPITATENIFEAAGKQKVATESTITQSVPTPRVVEETLPNKNDKEELTFDIKPSLNPTDILSDLILNPKYKTSKLLTYQQLGRFFEAKETSKLSQYEFDQVSAIIRKLTAGPIVVQQHFKYPLSSGIVSSTFSNDSPVKEFYVNNNIESDAIFNSTKIESRSTLLPSRIFTARFDDDYEDQESDHKVLVPVPSEVKLFKRKATNEDVKPVIIIAKQPEETTKPFLETPGVLETKFLGPEVTKADQKPIESFKFTIPSVKTGIDNEHQIPYPKEMKFDFGAPEIPSVKTDPKLEAKFAFKALNYEAANVNETASHSTTFSKKPISTSVNDESSSKVSSFGFPSFGPSQTAKTSNDDEKTAAAKEASTVSNFLTQASKPSKDESKGPLVQSENKLPSEVKESLDVKPFSFNLNASTANTTSLATMFPTAPSDTSKTFSFSFNAIPEKSLEQGEKTSTFAADAHSKVNETGQIKTPSFVFGDATKPASNAFNIASSQPEGAKSFTFPSADQTKAGDSTPPLFGLQNVASIPTKSGSDSSSQDSTPFVFGAPKSDTQSSFSFGTTQTSENKAFSIGLTSLSGKDETKPTVFGSSQTSESKPFSFGLSSGKDETKPTIFGAAQTSESKPFSFGLSSGKDETTPTIFGSQTSESKPFSFGLSSGKDKSKPSIFGAEPASQPSIFGVNSIQSKTEAFPNSQGAAIDKPSGSFGSFGNQTASSAPTFSFGNPEVKASTASAGVGGMFTFGNTSNPSSFGTQVSSGGGLHLGSQPTPPTSFTFPAPSEDHQDSKKPAQAPFSFSAPSVPPSFYFSAPPQQSSQPQASTFTFGASSQPTVFTFGAPSSQPSQPFVFGQSSDPAGMTFNLGSSSPALGGRPKTTPVSRRRPHK